MNPVPNIGVLSSLPLHDLDRKGINNDPNNTPKRFANMAQRFSKILRALLDDDPLDPQEFLRLVNKAKEDNIALPKAISDAICQCENHGLLEKTKTGKIACVGWTIPTPLRSLLNDTAESSGCDDLQALIADTSRKMRL